LYIGVVVDCGGFDFGVGVEGFVDGFVGFDVFQFGVYEGGVFVWFYVLEFDDGLELVVEVENHVVLEVVCGCYVRVSVFVCWSGD